MKKVSKQDLTEGIELVAIRQARGSLLAFVRWAWTIVEPGIVFQDNWHIQLICEYLEAITAGTIQRLVINIPPRYMKSLLVSVLWPCWEWYRRPAARYIFSSYAETLASHHSLTRRRLLQSRRYQRFAPGVRLTRDQQEKLEFHNTKGGIMWRRPSGARLPGKAVTDSSSTTRTIPPRPKAMRSANKPWTIFGIRCPLGSMTRSGM